MTFRYLAIEAGGKFNPEENFHLKSKIELWKLFFTTAVKSEEKIAKKRECLDSDCQDEPPRDSKANNIAMKAAQEAKEAEDAQQVAGAQAAHQVPNTK